MCLFVCGEDHESRSPIREVLAASEDLIVTVTQGRSWGAAGLCNFSTLNFGGTWAKIKL